MVNRDDDLWTHRGNKFVIGTLHGNLIEIEAQYNPKEVARQSTATWNVHPNTAGRQSKTPDNYRWMEYGSTEPRTLTVELLFDGYEEGTSVASIVADLESLTIPVNMVSARISERRPQICVAVWGTQKLRCVVTSVATKLTMFDASGEPLRAICTVTVKEVDAVAMMDADGDASNLSARDDKLSRASAKWRSAPRETAKPRPNPPGANTDFNDLE